MSTRVVAQHGFVRRRVDRWGRRRRADLRHPWARAHHPPGRPRPGLARAAGRHPRPAPARRPRRRTHPPHGTPPHRPRTTRRRPPLPPRAQRVNYPTNPVRCLRRPPPRCRRARSAPRSPRPRHRAASPTPQLGPPVRHGRARPGSPCAGRPRCRRHPAAGPRDQCHRARYRRTARAVAPAVRAARRHGERRTAGPGRAVGHRRRGKWGGDTRARRGRPRLDPSRSAHLRTAAPGTRHPARDRHPGPGRGPLVHPAPLTPARRPATRHPARPAPPTRCRPRPRLARLPRPRRATAFPGMGVAPRREPALRRTSPLGRPRPRRRTRPARRAGGHGCGKYARGHRPRELAAR